MAYGVWCSGSTGRLGRSSSSSNLGTPTNIISVIKNVLLYYQIMISTMPLLVLLLVVLSASLYYIIQAEGGFNEFPRLMERVGIHVEEIQMSKSKILNKFKFTNDQNAGDKTSPNEFESGDSRFSQGICDNNGDCFVGGCSGEVCSSEKNVISTCEFSDSFPSVRDWQCGCVSGICGWKIK